MQNRSSISTLAIAFGGASALALMASAATAAPQYDGGMMSLSLEAGSYGPSSLGGISGALTAPRGDAVSGFDGTSELDSIHVNGGSFNVPPDTMGAVGTTQFMETSNSAYEVFNKATGTATSLVSGSAFWTGLGQSGFGGDSRVRFDAPTQRWIVTALDGGADHNVHIAVSTTADALGPWQATTLAGYAGGIADYPTLAIDNNAVYIGTNNFPSAGGFQGTSLHVIPKADLFGVGAPTTANDVVFNTPYDGALPDRGFAIQGVNSTAVDPTGRVVATAIYSDGISGPGTGPNGLVRYDITNAGTATAAQTGGSGVLGPNDAASGPGRQPDGTRHIDTLDNRVSSSAWQQNGKIYTVFTVDDGTGHSAVRYEVLDMTTNAVIDTGLIRGGNFDYYQGSLAVNASGEVVIGYNRSGYQAGTGNIAFFERSFESNAAGDLILRGTSLLHQSSRGDYNNSEFGPGVNRWGDYSAVTLDPTNSSSFWAIGEYQKGNLCCLSGGRQISQWGTWVSDITLNPVPEPATWAMMLAGFGLVGGAMRRRARTAAVTA